MHSVVEREDSERSYSAGERGGLKETFPSENGEDTEKKQCSSLYETRETLHGPEKPRVEWERFISRIAQQAATSRQPSLEERARSKRRKQGRSVTGTSAHLAASTWGTAETIAKAWRSGGAPRA